MKAVILAAGQGTRLMPLTASKPKCLVPLLGTPLLAHQLRAFRELSVEDVTVVAGYRASDVAAFAPSCRIAINADYATTNMVASLFCATDLLSGSHDLIVSYGDIVFEPRVLSAILACDAPIALGVDVAWRQYWERRMPDPLGDAESMRLGSDGRVLELGKRPRSYSEIEGQYMGLFKIRSDHVSQLRLVYDRLDRQQRYDGQTFSKMYMTTFLQHLIDCGWRVQAIQVEHGWLELDSIADLDLYEGMARDGTLQQFYRLG
jgi:choline kinase